MKKLFIILVVAALFGAAHAVLLSYAEDYAKHQAPRYVPPTSAEIGPAPSPAGPSASMYDRKMAEYAQNIYDYEKLGHYAKYYQEHVKPHIESFAKWTNLSFAFVYFACGAIFIWVLAVTLANNADRIQRCARFVFVGLPTDIFCKLGLAKIGQRHQLTAAAKEFETAKSLYENGLLSAEEFARRKELIRRTLNGAD